MLTVGERAGDAGQRIVSLDAEEDPEALLARVGSVPLPPYIHEPLADPDRYQTMFASEPGSVAAPTAGLHLTRACSWSVAAVAGADVAHVTLDVGLATFRPITAATVADHRMHAERYDVPDATLAACDRAGPR